MNKVKIEISGESQTGKGVLAQIIADALHYFDLDNITFQVKYPDGPVKIASPIDNYDDGMLHEQTEIVIEISDIISDQEKEQPFKVLRDEQHDLKDK